LIKSLILNTKHRKVDANIEFMDGQEDVKYKVEMYDNRDTQTSSSASEISNLCLFLLPDTKSVLDVGCGVGTFLYEFKKRGVTEVFGLEGPWVPQHLLKIEKSEFKVIDLEQTLKVDKKFDLVICLEVAEHLKKDTAEKLIEFLTGCSEFVLFSAAVPLQGGNNHVNEQWLSYWNKLFLQKGFFANDIIRPIIWNNENVAFWYAQNTILYSKNSNQFKELCDFGSHNLIHPKNYLAKAQKSNILDRILVFINNLQSTKYIKVIYEKFSK
jgi:SAM-dependent methyltransferase